MAVRAWTKPQTQSIIKKLRAAGYVVEKTTDGGGYIGTDASGAAVFRAMRGTRGYLIQHDNDLFEYEIVPVKEPTCPEPV